MRNLVIFSFMVFILGCANNQNQVVNDNNFASKRDKSKDGTSSYSLECRNCMAKFKVTLKSQPFTKELLYKACPVCKR